MKKENKNLKFGFTLLELLIVVLIIGILAAIALPQYRMAVTKVKVASILPLMRRWYDAAEEYHLQHGDFCPWDCQGSDLGVNWPSDWKNSNGGSCGDSSYCSNDYWGCMGGGMRVECIHDTTGDDAFYISMYLNNVDLDEYFNGIQGKISCMAVQGTGGDKICKSLGKLFGTDGGKYNVYIL